jgi:hypothetical protein
MRAAAHPGRRHHRAPLGLAGHSDADAVAHAVTDALLGAAGLGDIGRHFPPTDEQWRDADSIELLHRAAQLAAEQNYQVVNVDVTVVCEAPRIAPHADAMRAPGGRARHRAAAGLREGQDERGHGLDRPRRGHRRHGRGARRPGRRLTLFRPEGCIDAVLEWLADLPPVLIYLVIGIGAAVENVFPPVPADTFVLLGAFLAASGRAEPVAGLPGDVGRQRGIGRGRVPAGLPLRRGASSPRPSATGC